MTTYILIIIIVAGGTSISTSIDHIMFNSKEQCESTRVKVLNFTNQVARMSMVDCIEVKK